MEEIRRRLEANAKAFDDARAYGGVSISIWDNGAKTCRDASALIAELERENEKWKIAYDAVMESNDDKDDAIRDLNALLSSSRAEEREACAKVADDEARDAYPESPSYTVGRRIASAIRARATKE